MPGRLLRRLVRHAVHDVALAAAALALRLPAVLRVDVDRFHLLDGVVPHARLHGPGSLLRAHG